MKYYIKYITNNINIILFIILFILIFLYFYDNIKIIKQGFISSKCDKDKCELDPNYISGNCGNIFPKPHGINGCYRICPTHRCKADLSNCINNVDCKNCGTSIQNVKCNINDPLFDHGQCPTSYKLYSCPPDLPYLISKDKSLPLQYSHCSKLHNLKINCSKKPSNIYEK
jgi:hypothetical protein